MPPIRVYLAGPEVFLVNARQIGEQKKLLCSKYGFTGIFPIDVEVNTKNKSPPEIGYLISDVNEKLIKSCDFVVANITPFRGPSADVGTVYEIGFAHALGKKVFAYSNIATSFTERTIKALDGKVKRDTQGTLRDVEGMFIEENCLADNLMIDGCVHANSKIMVIENAPEGEEFSYLVGFEKCLAAAKKMV